MTQIKRSSCSYFVHIILVLYSSSCSTLFPMEKYRSIPHPNQLIFDFSYLPIAFVTFSFTCFPSFLSAVLIFTHWFLQPRSLNIKTDGTFPSLAGGLRIFSTNPSLTSGKLVLAAKRPVTQATSLLLVC